MNSQIVPPWLQVRVPSFQPPSVVEEPPIVEATIVEVQPDELVDEPDPLPPRASSTDEFGLYPRQRLFADEWLTGEATGKRFNGLAAWKHAGYAIFEQNPYANPSKMLRHPKVSEYIKKRMTELTMTAEEVLMRLSELAREDFGDTVRINPQTQNLEQDPQAVLKHAKFIKSFSKDSNGNPKVEFQDPMAAVRDMIRVLGLAKEGLEIGGFGGGPIRMELVFVGPNQEREQYRPAGIEELAPLEDFTDLDKLELEDTQG